MKKIAFYLTVILLSVMVCTSCGKDDDTKAEDAGKSGLTFDGVSFTPNSSCELWHDNDNNAFNMHLWDGSLYLNTKFQVKGEGDWLELDLYKNSDSPVGTYTYGDDEEEGTFSAYMKIGVYQSTEGYTSSQSSVSFTGGTAKIEGTDDPFTFKVTIDLTGENNESYKGTTKVDFRYIMQVY